ncbi:hypothetical protein ACRAWF_46785 [Streptomyces sp. L7]
MFERLDKEESVVRGELAALREKVAGLEERLAHLTITRETLLSLTGDGHRSGMDEPTLPPSGHVLDSGVLSGAGQTAREPSVSPGPLDLELARERILVLLARAEPGNESAGHRGCDRRAPGPGWRPLGRG